MTESAIKRTMSLDCCTVKCHVNQVSAEQDVIPKDFTQNYTLNNLCTDL